MMTDTLWRGLLAGAAGVAAMTLAEKIEQQFTKRPNSYVPARALDALTGTTASTHAARVGRNWAMHWGQGIALGALRSTMARRGLRGPMSSFLFLNIRLANDQVIENATGVGALPWTWPVDEQAIDLVHKAIYAWVTGAVADRLVVGPPGMPAPTGPWLERENGDHRDRHERAEFVQASASQQTPTSDVAGHRHV
jgi:hypothetical protein